MTTLVLVAIGEIVLVAFVVVLHRLARDNEPVEQTKARVWKPTVAELRAAYAEDGLVYKEPRGMSSDAPQPSWHETERLRKKHREQERARKKRQKNRKGGRS